MGRRTAVVVAEWPTRKTYFSQITRSTSSLISASMPASVHAWRN